MKIHINVRKLVAFIATIIATVVLLWMTTSWMEVVLKNTTDNPEYSEWNFWVNIVTVSATVTSIEDDVVTVKVNNDIYSYYAENSDLEEGDSVRILLQDGKVENAF